MTGLNFDSAKVVIPSLISNPLRSEATASSDARAGNLAKPSGDSDRIPDGKAKFGGAVRESRGISG